MQSVQDVAHLCGQPTLYKKLSRQSRRRVSCAWWPPTGWCPSWTRHTFHCSYYLRNTRQSLSDRAEDWNHLWSLAEVLAKAPQWGVTFKHLWCHPGCAAFIVSHVGLNIAGCSEVAYLQHSASSYKEQTETVQQTGIRDLQYVRHHRSFSHWPKKTPLTPAHIWLLFPPGSSNSAVVAGSHRLQLHCDVNPTPRWTQ